MMAVKDVGGSYYWKHATGDGKVRAVTIHHDGAWAIGLLPTQLDNSIKLLRSNMNIRPESESPATFSEESEAIMAMENFLVSNSWLGRTSR